MNAHATIEKPAADEAPQAPAPVDPPAGEAAQAIAVTDPKTFAATLDTIGAIGRQLASLQTDVANIEKLAVDKNGDARAKVSQGNIAVDLLMPPKAMLLIKKTEVDRAIDALRAQFDLIEDEADKLSARCRPDEARTTPLVAFTAPARKPGGSPAIHQRKPAVPQKDFEAVEAMVSGRVAELKALRDRAKPEPVQPRQTLRDWILARAPRLATAAE